ncbi:NADP-dependent isocitrate dehydrogenase [Marinomonas sp. IMCC 4694]|uniref:NADP-dependent isocitrate dehydrogenase n=1 Tax=Marinomonas sp. IMCC 4694 TaxID=2605432 RepID=UPI0011E69EC9|nr:NADP-dependent isocitrate dehydrogenase [Marinomonas sp. IMCC 4694]TYL47381.1 NADP-dependent isocitrate dehydrogenase [Marinomonas sp. IMCC 4694]
MSKQTIYYTLTDEAPALATASLLPIFSAFAKEADITLELTDISLASRILSSFSDLLPADKQAEDGLKFLGELTASPEANIVKLPNISASLPQLNAAIKELNAQGYNLPNYPENPQTDEEKDVLARYSKVLGSAVNPVLRQGNSDRRAPAAVKGFARKNPHSMGKWSKTSVSHVDYMRDGDFYSSEQSVTMEKAQTLRLEFVGQDGSVEVKKSLPVIAGEIIDSMNISTTKLRAFFEKSLQEAKEDNIMWSVHLKATMMKVSHPIVFGHAVTVFFKDVFEKYDELFKEIGVNPNNGLGSVYDKIQTLPAAQQEEIKQAIQDVYKTRPELAMVDSDKGITNLHVPSDVIVDASMPAMIRNSGKMWGRDGKAHDAKAVIPDSTYARIYQETINFCKTNGAFDPVTMGTVPNVGLMAQKAEEYGSHDKTFELKADGVMRVVDADGNVLMQHNVEKGDIWRACQTKDAPIRDWVKLGVTRARQSSTPAVFWLEENRAHDNELRKKVQHYLQEHDTNGLDIRIMNYNEAIRFSMERIIRGQDTISVTGNILRDYLTDLFPILELGTSAKMLSIVPMLEGGGMYETGAGGSAPKHVQQLMEENYLRWDSLGEFLAVAVSFEELGIKHNNEKAKVLANCLDKATGKLLDTNKSPSRKVGEIDNRGSHFYLAMYWAQELATQSDNAELTAKFAPLATVLADQEATIVAELAAVQGKPAGLSGYYHIDLAEVTKIMRPSTTFNTALSSL